MAEQQDGGIGCGAWIVMALVFAGISTAFQSCNPKPDVPAEPAGRSGPIDVYNTPSAKKTRDDIRRFERDHNLKPYEEEN
jgi:hypothetical protein